MNRRDFLNLGLGAVGALAAGGLAGLLAPKERRAQWRYERTETIGCTPLPDGGHLLRQRVILTYRDAAGRVPAVRDGDPVGRWEFPLGGVAVQPDPRRRPRLVVDAARPDRRDGALPAWVERV